MAKPGSDRDGAMVDKQAGKKSKEKLSPFTKTPKLDRSELLGKEGKAKSSMKRKLSFTTSPPRTEERDSDTDDSDPGQSSETWGERLVPPCRIYADKDGPDKKKVKKETGSKKSQAPNLLFGYPLSERKQMALLMQMTANSPDSTPSHPSQTTPVQKKVPSSASSRQKDKVNKRNERGETPLHMAAIRGDAKQVKELISLGADVNVKDFAGWTPLHEACNLGFYDVAKVLIAAGAEVNTQGLDDDTPLHDASSSGHKDVVKLLLRHGGNAFQANKRGERPVDVADSQELEQLLKGEVPLSDQDDSSSESEDPPSVNPSSVDDNMEDSDTEKDSEGKPATKASSSVPGLDEYEFKDEEEEEDLSKALNDRHILRRELRQREKEDKDRNNVAGKQGGKGDSSSKSKKQKSSHVHCSSDTSSDESISEKRNSPTCSQGSESLKADTRSKKDNAEQKDKGKVKRKSKSQNKNKENQEDGKENSKSLVLSLATVSESTEKVREEDSFKMSFSPKDDSSVHLFHLSSIKSPKLNHSLTDKQTPLKQENTKMCVSISDGSCPMDGVKYNHYTDADYCTEASSTKGCKHKEKSKHQQKDSSVDGDDGRLSPYKDGSIGNSIDSNEGALRKMDVDGKVVKKHKLKHKEKDKHRREYEAEQSRHRQKEARKDSHRNLEFDREFWKENFFKSDETEEPLPTKKEGEDLLQKSSDSSPVKDERNTKDKHSSSKDKRQREEREKDKAVKKGQKEAAGKEEKVKDSKLSERDERLDCHSLGRIPEESLQSNSMKEETEEKPISGITADQEQLEPSEKGSREKTDKRLLGKEKDSEKMEKRHLDKEKKVKTEQTDKAESQNSVDRWKEKERTGTISSHSPGDKNYKENEKLKSSSATKKHEDNRKNKDKIDKRSDREYSVGDHREKDRTNSDKKGKPLEKTTDHSKSDRSKEKDCERKKRDKIKDGALSSNSNLKLLLEEKKSYLSENSRSLSSKSKDECMRTPEKDRDRRERDRDSERHKDKERSKDRSQQAKVSKIKLSEADVDKAKSKATPATRDTKPKEKRLVNDDLMQTSFERMLSLKDQEIEQWHRKHLEKIKQKERERLKQRPLADPGKSRPKDRTKTEQCLSKEIMRSKSSEASDLHSREKPLKDGTSPKTVSLDGKSLSSIGAKVMSAVENCLTRSPRPESERCGLMSRSVSMVSVASSEDSCQATTLTPRHGEYDSDMNLEASDSQPAFLQSSLVIQATRSSSVHIKDCNSLPEVQQSNRTMLSNRHETPYLRAILDEDANSSTEGKAVENIPKSSLPSEELRTRENLGETEKSLSSQAYMNAVVDSVADREGSAPGCSTPQMLNKDLPSKNLALSQSSLSQGSGSQTGSTEQKALPFESPVVKDIQCPETSHAECSNKESDQLSVHAATLSAESSELADMKIFQQREPLLPSAVESLQQHDMGTTEVSDQKDKLEVVDGQEQESVETVSENFRTEWVGSPLPSTSSHIPCSTTGESLPSFRKSNSESKCSEEAMDVNNPDCKKSRPSSDNAGPCIDAQMEKKDSVSSVIAELKAEEMTDMPQISDKNCGADDISAPAESSSSEGSVAAEDLYESKAEATTELMEVTPSDEQPESSSSSAVEEQSQSFVQSAAQSDIGSSGSRSSSPQSGEGESDSLGAKLKVRTAEEEVDMHVPHPRKRKMPKVLTSQPCSTNHQEKERGQQSLAAIVDSLKLEEIEPYQTERANPYYEFLHIRKKIEEKRKVLCSVTPQPPQYYDEYVTFNGSYLLDGNPLSKLCIPTITPPPSLPEQLKEMFKQQEVVRMKLRLQHSIEREKLIVSNEQEVLRVHYRAARTLANQTLPFSACTVLLDAEVYNMPQDVQSDDGKTSVRDRFNARQFMSWLQDVDDKFDKLKTCLLMRQQHEAAALNAVQRLEWQLKLQELDPATYKSTSIFEIPEFYIPLVEVNDDFDLTPI
ncbi:Ankyrin repeat domain-containing protein 12 Ankyrin repeat-containing cofactor 2 GAC-1 protein [Channa argus]|uniref:Ankyrin repeat domain-containing protein 12 Ankyrin repeat-containing cofactor 2 GAC-1 protein n=1 Tax=Channa argus TaxID=215402 RepID=A0A6G1Q8Q4_CHAAH|nr:Ankyrin repeat domain-containing protein 12 Ankyrin repeat-containing cofactor 2 GAC-1 protein [Channa argus]